MVRNSLRADYFAEKITQNKTALRFVAANEMRAFLRMTIQRHTPDFLCRLNQWPNPCDVLNFRDAPPNEPPHLPNRIWQLLFERAILDIQLCEIQRLELSPHLKSGLGSLNLSTQQQRRRAISLCVRFDDIRQQQPIHFRQPNYPCLIFRFISFVEIESSLNIVAMSKAAFFLFLLQPFTHIVAPAALRHECVPNKNLFFARAMSFLKAPFQNLFVCAFLQCAFDKSRIFNFQKANATSVKSRAAIVICWQFSMRVQADFIEHSSKENDATNFFVRTSQPKNFHFANWFTAPAVHQRFSG